MNLIRLLLALLCVGNLALGGYLLARGDRSPGLLGVIGGVACGWGVTRARDGTTEGE